MLEQDYEDSDILTSNNFETNSFKENNAEINSNFYGHIERLSNEKTLIQNQFNSKIIDLQTQIMKLTNTIEKIETSKTELEVELTKSRKECRQSQRNLQTKCSELDNVKLEFAKQSKMLESEYTQKVSHLTNLNKTLQEQISEEKRTNKNHQDFLNEKVNQLNVRIQEKDLELSTHVFKQNQLQATIDEMESKLTQLTRKIAESDESNANYYKQLMEENHEIESFKVSEIKLKNLILDLTSNVNSLESKIFEQKHELNESRNSKNALQTQLMELQQQQINKEKEYNILAEKMCYASRKINELEETLKNQIQLSNSYAEHLKTFENKHKIQNVDMMDQNEHLQKRLTQLEETIVIQNRMIEETSAALASSREGEGTAVSNLNMTIEELDKLIEEPKIQLKSPTRISQYNKSPKYVKECYNDFIISSPASCTMQRVGDINKILSPNKRVIKNVKQIIQDFQERLNTLDSDRLEGFDKIQNQDKEIKNLKVQLRKYANHNRTLEISNTEKQNEIENLSDEIAKLKATVLNLKAETNKFHVKYRDNVENYRNSISRISEESQNNIESRDKYLQSISNVMKDVLQNSLSSYLEWPKIIPNQSTIKNINSNIFLIETSTQTDRVDSNLKENLELSGNLTGTFCFSSQNNNTPNDPNLKQTEKRSRIHDSIHEKKTDNQLINVKDEKIKPIPKKIIPQENKKEIFDSVQSWPALREIISSELSTILKKYELQRAQYKSIPNEAIGLHHLMAELSTKENVIAHLLSRQNSNSSKNHGASEAIGFDHQDNVHEAPPSTSKNMNKTSFANQSNFQVRGATDSKKKNLLLKSRMENQTNINTNKRCTKLDNQKQCCNSITSQTETSRLINKKVTTISIQTPDKLIENSSTCNQTFDRSKMIMTRLSMKKLTTISLPSTLPVTSKYLKIVSGDEAVQNDIFDKRLISLFLNSLVNVIRLRFQLEENQNLTNFYKLLYRRSIDCSKIISINDILESIIYKSNNSSKTFHTKRKVKKLKIFVHVISICRYLSKSMLATKLLASVDNEIIDQNEFVGFFDRIFHNFTLSPELEFVPDESLETLVNEFIKFCVDQNNMNLLISRSCARSGNVIFTASNTIVLDNLKRNINTIQTIIESQVSKKYLKSKSTSYKNNVQALIVKVKQMGHIIDDQNALITIRNDSISKLQKELSEKSDQIYQLQSSWKHQEESYSREKVEHTNFLSMILSVKAYLINIINCCERNRKDDLFSYDALIHEEESIYLSHFNPNECNSSFTEFIETVRDGIRAALRLSSSVKAILI